MVNADHQTVEHFPMPQRQDYVTLENILVLPVLVLGIGLAVAQMEEQLQAVQLTRQHLLSMVNADHLMAIHFQLHLLLGYVTRAQQVESLVLVHGTGLALA